MIGADLDQQHELKHGILSSIFCLLDPDLHLNCGSGSRLQNKCGSMQIRIRIHSPAYTFSKINNKKVEFFNALLTRVAEPEPEPPFLSRSRQTIVTDSDYLRLVPVPI